MKKQGDELEFISWVKRDGSGVKRIPKYYLKTMQEETFTLHVLSLSKKTYLANYFNWFVVKLKNKIYYKTKEDRSGLKNCTTKCKYIKNKYVGSGACSVCKYFDSKNRIEQYVICKNNYEKI